ncbi:G-protein coupled receptor 54-like [Branchiostoma floridae x Branchiostoma japonicum]
MANNTTWENSTVPEDDSSDVKSLPDTDGSPLGAEAIAGPIVFGLICVVGLLGNLLVIYVVWKYDQMKSVTNYYIVNLAVTDVSFLLCCVPFTAAGFTTTSWNYGLFMCKFVNYFMQVTVQATCLTLAAISVDRYCAIVHPISSIPYRSPAVAMTISACIWISSFLLSLPVAISAQLESQEWKGPQILCREDWTPHEQKVYNVYIVINSYVIPLLVSATFYGLIVRSLRARVIDYDGQNNEGEQHALRRQKRVTRMVAVVVLLFALCWLPNHVLNMLAVFDKNFPLSYATLCIKMFAHCLSYANSAANPFVYGFMGEHFRQNFKKAFPRCFTLNRVGAVAPNVAQLATIEQQLGEQAGASLPANGNESNRRHKLLLQPTHLNLPAVDT